MPGLNMFSLIWLIALAIVLSRWMGGKTKE